MEGGEEVERQNPGDKTLSTIAMEAVSQCLKGIPPACEIISVREKLGLSLVPWPSLDPWTEIAQLFGLFQDEVALA